VPTISGAGGQSRTDTELPPPVFQVVAGHFTLSQRIPFSPVSYRQLSRKPLLQRRSITATVVGVYIDAQSPSFVILTVTLLDFPIPNVVGLITCTWPVCRRSHSSVWRRVSFVPLQLPPIHSTAAPSPLAVNSKR
jgi:hypothetical protein